MRITQQIQTSRTIASLQYTQSNLAEIQAQMSSGRQITKPSDDPSGTVNALALRGELARNTQYQANASDANAWLSTVNTAVVDVNTKLTSVRTTLVKALNTGTSDTSSRAALADQIDSIKQLVFNDANATYLGRPVFGGTTSQNVAYTQDTSGNVTYVGDSNAVTRQVGDNTTVQLSQSSSNGDANGNAVFGKAGSNAYGTGVSTVFDLLSDISAKVRAGTATGTDLTNLDSALATVKATQAQEGSAMTQAQQAQTSAQTNQVALKSRLSDIADADLADMAIKLSAADLSYQASMQVTAKVSSRSLMDFVQ